MRILTFGLFEATKGAGPKPLTGSQQEFLNSCTKGAWTWNPETGLVDIQGDFNFSGRGEKDFSGVRFGSVSGYFYCSGNQLTSLEGAPEEVGRTFYCSDNQLTSLEGAPEKVGGNFECTDNKLTSLVGAPKEVGGNFNCWRNKLTSLGGAPKKIYKRFMCDSFELNDWGIKGFLDLLDGNGAIYDLDATKRLIPTLTTLLDELSPEELYKTISKREDKNEILSIIRKENPQIWDRIKGFGGRSSIGADMGDLFF